MDFYKYKILKVSSADKIRSTDTNSDFHIDISKVTHDATQRCIGVSLIECAFENFIYNVRTGVNDVFSFEESGQSRVNITFPVGHYNLSEVIIYLTAQINSGLVTGSVVITQNTYNKKLVLTFTGTTAKVLVDGISTISNTLGFYTSTVSFSSSIEAEYLFRLNGVQQAYLNCPQLSRGHLIDSALNNRRDVISVIPVNAGFGETVFYSNPNHNDRITWKNFTTLSELHFKLTNGLGEALDIQKSNLKLILALLY